MKPYKNVNLSQHSLFPLTGMDISQLDWNVLIQAEIDFVVYPINFDFFPH